MTARDFLTNVAFILAVMAAGAVLELAVPWTAACGRRGRRAANLALAATVILVNWLLTSLAAIAALWLRPTGAMARIGTPTWLQIAAGFVILDFSIGYLSHRTLHLIPAMWRFHRIHHSDQFLDVTTTFRTHPVETAWRFLFSIVPVWIVGIPAQAVVIQRLVQTTNGILEHANVRLWTPIDRILSLVWVTPDVHKIHHSRAVAETNSNYGNVLSIYDRLLGTFTPTTRARSVVYGLDDADPRRAASFGGLLAMPFAEGEPAAEPPASYQNVSVGPPAAR